jgi:hypothetical protein
MDYDVTFKFKNNKILKQIVLIFGFNLFLNHSFLRIKFVYIVIFDKFMVNFS